MEVGHHQGIMADEHITIGREILTKKRKSLNI
jgi:hypothetical protein